VTSSEPLLPVPEDDALDAAASAVVDGVATPEEAAVVAAAPDGATRVAAMRAVADAVGSPPGAQSSVAAERGRAAALAAFGAETDHDSAAADGGTRLAMLPQAPRAGGRSRNLPRMGAIAATLLLVVGIGAFAAAALFSDGSQDSFTSAAPTREPAGQLSGAESVDANDPAFGRAATTPAPKSVEAGASAGPPAPAAAPAAGAGAAGPPPVVNGGDLGRQDEVEALAQRAAAALDGVPDATVAARDAALPSEVQACAAAVAATPGETVTALRYRAVGSFQGTPAVFLAFDRASNPPRVLLVLARSDCSVLASTHF
jgi:hypothetical protein